MLGPSGCGKTTTLRMIAGLELPTTGTIQLGADDVTYRRAAERDIAFVFQLFALYPHMNVRANIGFPLKCDGRPRAEIETEAVRFAGYRVPLDSSRRPPAGSDRQVILGIRPEDFEDVRFSPPGLPTIDVQITLVEDLGPEALAFFALDTERVEPELLGVASDRSDQEALIAGDRRALFSATLDAATDARPGRSCRLTVNPARFHFFSAYNGENLLAPGFEVSDRLEEAV